MPRLMNKCLYHSSKIILFYFSLLLYKVLLETELYLAGQKKPVLLFVFANLYSFENQSANINLQSCRSLVGSSIKRKARVRITVQASKRNMKEKNMSLAISSQQISDKNSAMKK